MAKKKEKKVTERSGTEKASQAQVIIDLLVRVNKLEQRLDRIVVAIDKSKKVGGL